MIPRDCHSKGQCERLEDVQLGDFCKWLVDQVRRQHATSEPLHVRRFLFTMHHVHRRSIVDQPLSLFAEVTNSDFLDWGEMVELPELSGK